jgi:hypothetical protein
MNHFARRAAESCLIISLMPSLSPAIELSVTNGSFEDISGQTPYNEFTLVVPNGWTAFNTNALTVGSGLYIGTLETDGSFFDPPPNPAPDGSRVAILYNQTQKGNGEFGIEQLLTDTLEPYTRYTLTVEVGNIGSGMADDGSQYDLSGFPGYRIEFLAGSTVLASDTNSLSISERTFETSTVVFTPPVSHPAMGSSLGIRLISLNMPVEPDSNSSPYDAHEVDFDHVRLMAEPVTTSNSAPYRYLVESGLVSSNASDSEFESVSILDSDNDTHLDWQEHITGTDPSNALSYFDCSIALTGGVVNISWSIISNRSYYVGTSTNLAAGFDTIFPAPSGQFIDTPSINTASLFYHIQVVAP